MLGDRRLRDPELGLNGRADGAGGHLALGDQLENPATHRIAEYIERVHAEKISRVTYISQILSKRVGQAEVRGDPLPMLLLWALS